MPINTKRRVAVLLAGIVAGVICVFLWTEAVRNRVRQQVRPLVPVRRVVSNPSYLSKPDVPYKTGGGRILHLDVYQPMPPSGKRGPFPVVVCIHGGSWRAGNKRDCHQIADALAESGLVAVCVEYRLLAPDGKTNRWPVQMEDVRDALHFVRGHANHWNGRPDKLGVWGHSSGAQMAALLAVESPHPDGVKAVVAWSGPMDFVDAAHSPLAADEMPLLPVLFGATRAQNPAVYREASPVYHASVSTPTAPLLLLHGSGDAVVPPFQSWRMARALRRARRPVRLVVLHDADHNFSTPADFVRAQRETVAFFRQNLL